MAGAEEFQRFGPRIREDTYLPDEHMTQDIMASGTRRKLADLQRVGEIQAEAARTPYDAVTKGYNAFQEGKSRALNAEEQKQQMRQRQESHGQEMEKGQLGLEHARGAQAEENAYRDFLNKSDTEGGKSRREQMNTADFTSHITAPKNAQEEHDLRMQEIALQMKQANAALGQMGLAAKDRLELKARQDAQDAFTGVYSNQTLTPEQKEAKAEELEHTMGGGKVPGPVLTSYRMAARNGAASALQQGQDIHQITLQGQDTYQHMAQATQDASADADSISHLAQLRNNYSKNLRFPGTGVGQVLGKAGGESDIAANQRNEFAATLDAMKKPDLAENIRGSSPRDVASRMNDVISHLSQETQASWQHQKGSIHPSMVNRPEVGQTEQKVQGLGGLTRAGADKNTLTLAPGLGPTGPGANKAFLTGGGAPPPGGGMPTGGGIVPAGYNPRVAPGQNAAAHAGALPVPGGKINLPPHPGQAQPVAAAGPAGAPPPPQQPFGGQVLPGQQMPYGYDFTKYKVNPQTPADGTGLGGP